MTVLYPFAEVDDDTAPRSAIAAAVPAFDGDVPHDGPLPRRRRLPRPRAAAPFHELIARCIAAFPDCPPYGGTIPDPLPHLTVADGVDEPTADALDAKVRSGLPITSRSTASR